MSFYTTLTRIEEFDLSSALSSISDSDISRAIGKEHLSETDFLTLISDKATPYLEKMAQRASEITRRQFGRAIGLYTPMYLSNHCANHCVYCGFNCRNDIPRTQLTLDEVRTEAEAIAKSGLKHLLILTGDAPRIATVDYLKECCAVLREYFSSISIEIYALDTDQYASLIESGVDGLTIYQETYNQELYKHLHPKGPKKDYRYRLDAPERGCIAGMRNVNIGCLLGLDRDWRRDIFVTAMHAAWLQKKYPEVEVNISLPRMRPHEGEFQPGAVISDRDMVQIMTALRIFMPRCGINISTREHPDFRENILRLGVTRMSAGVSTAVGGHTKEEDKTEQFEISDSRSVAEISAMLKERNFQPVYKDWDEIS
ncbi:2-iminoacetate synthase ThiH [Desulfosediminicola flagellatus]|uniref:2-iminoacetate synthase ThiH n=1 Tax=Desulfosediminicola flagellatus TaxID=2569541 RepID=UPI0010AC6A2B|nr:2-iminoacetate synthase ThiH [Desulfosediminicola flagellatus]